MEMSLSRRRFLAASASVAAVGGFQAVLPGPARAASASPIGLIAERRTIEVRGKAASVFGIRQADGTPGLVLDPGQKFRINLANRSGEDTIIHWHGQTPPYGQDGVAEFGTPLIAAGADQDYDFAARPGTHWMHSHQGLQEQSLMAAPLIVRTDDDLRSDVQDVTVLLQDFTFRDPAEVLAGLTGGASHGNMQMSGTMQGHAMHAPGMQMDMGLDMPMGAGEHAPAMNHAGDAAVKMSAAMDMNDVEYDAYLANDRTLDDPLVVRTERGGRVRLRLINGASSTAFWIELGALEGSIVAVDGNPVTPLAVRRFPMSQAQRVDVILRMPAAGGAFAILAQREGDRQRTGIILATPDAPVTKIADVAEAAVAPADLSLEHRLSALHPPAPVKADVTHRIHLTGTMMPYTWSIDGRTWGDHRPLRVARGQRVVLEIVNGGHMAHPMHLHGHHFQVVELNGKKLRGAVRDTVLVPPAGSATVALVADNPGRWLLHCHNLFHMATGMMTELAYG